MKNESIQSQNRNTADKIEFEILPENGLPDIVVIKEAYIGIKIKAPKNKQSEPQKAIQADIEKAGGKYIIARSLDNAKVIFEKDKK